MKTLLTSAALAAGGAAAMLAQTGSGTRTRAVTRTRAQSAAPAGPQAPAPAAEAAKHRAWLNKNCVGCHNSRTASHPKRR